MDCIELKSDVFSVQHSRLNKKRAVDLAIHRPEEINEIVVRIPCDFGAEGIRPACYSGSGQAMLTVEIGMSKESPFSVEISGYAVWKSTGNWKKKYIISPEPFEVA
jgi:hypothetical protein